MASYGILKPISTINEPRDLTEVNSKRFEKFKTNKIALLKRNQLVKFIPSFLIRTLHDYVTGEQEKSRYQSLLLDSWQRCGLNEDSARTVLERLYGIGPQLFDLLDKSYFEGSPHALDKRFFRDLTRANWDKYFSSPHLLSPMRMKEALKSGSDEMLTEREKAFTAGIYQTHKKEKLGGVRSQRGMSPIYAKTYRARVALLCLRS